ncbi:MAG: MOSC domain-containing protein [Prosthecobacter sp.]
MSANANANAKVREIYIGAEREGPMTFVPMVEALAGKGLAGGRYAAGTGTYSRSKGVRDVTLIEIEALWDLFGTTGLDLHASVTRRNIVTEGVRLAELIGRTFSIGPVSLLGLRPCPPCRHLARLVGIPEVLSGLARSGGIYAQILNDGVIRVEDALRVASAAAPSPDSSLPAR